MPDPVNILVRMPNWLGDCVMAMPALRHLAETLPSARLCLAGRSAFRNLLCAQPGIAGFVEAPGSGFGKLIKGMSGAKRLARDAGLDPAVDLGLLFTNSLSTAAWMWRVGAKKRLGYDLDCRRYFLTHPVPCGGVEQSWHFVKYYMWLAQTAETILCREHEIAPKQVEPLARYLIPSLSVSQAARDEAAAILKKAGIAGRYAAIAPASAYGLVKDWPPGHYRALVEKLNRDFDLPVLVTGGGQQADACAEIAAGQSAACNIAGATTLDGFTGLLAGASLFVGGDSGGAHVAAALGIPTLVIFGITNPSRTKPTGLRVASLGEGEEKDIKLNTPEAREAARRVLAAIRPEAVAEAAGELLEDAAVSGQ